MNKIHEGYMKLCFSLAKNARGKTSPNPLVGSIIVKDGHIISQGHHRKSGLPHAEADALNNATESVKGSTLYCNLEPCCHTNKKTPPCTQAIIASGISKVVISNLDPNPYVAGNGVELLKQAGIEVITGILEDEGKILNEVFFHHIINKMPFIHVKWAQTLDGKIATNSYSSKWITDSIAREYVHQERSLYDAIVVGAQTIRMDNPSLTTRTQDQVSCPIRIVFSKSGNLPKDAKIFNDEFKDKTLVICPKNSFNMEGIQTVNFENKKLDDLPHVLEKLYQLGICSLYVEGGANLLTYFIREKAYQRLSAYIAPKFIGAGINVLGELGIDQMNEAKILEAPHWKILGNDILLESKRNVCLQD